MSRPVRTDAEIAEGRATIVNAAARVMASTGYRGATMAAIAAEAGCSPPTLYNYFASKDEILRGMAVEVTTHLHAPFEAPVDPEASAEDRITRLLAGMYTECQGQQAIMAAFTTLTAESCNTVLEGAHVDAERMFATAFVGWVGRHLTLAERGGLDPVEAGYLLNGISHANFLRWMHEEFDWHLPDNAARAARFFCSAVGA